MSKESNTYIQLKNINKTYGNYQASKDINFSIEKGKLVGLLGPSGSGKTTILRMIAGLETPDSGDILIDGVRINDIPASKRGIGFVFQNYALFRYKTVYENIAFGLKIEKMSKSMIHDRVMELIELVGLKGLEKRYPNQLSGGQKQRVAFARALAVQPQLLLLDEPFAAIDAKVRKELRSWLKELVSTVGITSIFVTHDQDEAIEVADDIIISNKGRIEQVGSPIGVYKNPATAFVAQFIGQSSRVKNAEKLKGFNHLEEGLDALIRPEYVSVYKENETIKYPLTSEKGRVEKVFFRGNYLELLINVNNQYIVANRQLNEEPIMEGEIVNLFIHTIFIIKGDRTFTVDNGVLISENYAYI